MALTGFVARYEGMFVLLFYIINMLILFNLISEERQISMAFKSLLASAFIICLIGLYNWRVVISLKRALGNLNSASRVRRQRIGLQIWHHGLWNAG